MPGGRPRKPTEQKALEGTLRAERLAVETPRPPAVLPRAPAWLSKTAKKHYQTLGPRLVAYGFAGQTDADALAVYCQLWARWQEAEEFLRDNGSTYVLRDETGKPRYVAQFPQVAIANRLAKEVRAYQQVLGLTPADRSRVTSLPTVLAPRGPNDGNQEAEERLARRVIPSQARFGHR